LFLFDPIGNVAVIGIELVARIVVGLKLLVVLGDITVQLVATGRIDLAGNIGCFFMDQPVLLIYWDCFIGGIGENRRNRQRFEQSALLFILLLFLGLNLFKHFIVLGQGIDRTDTEHRGKFTIASFGRMRIDNIARDHFQALWIVVELPGINAFDIIVIVEVVLHALGRVFTPVINLELQHVTIPDRIDNHILVQTLIKQIIRGEFEAGFRLTVFLKNRRSGKTKHLRIAEELLDILMGLTKLAAVTFIKDKHHFLVFEIIDVFQIAIRADGAIELLNGGDNQFVMALIQLLDQSMRAIGAVD